MVSKRDETKLAGACLFIAIMTANVAVLHVLVGPEPAGIPYTPESDDRVFLRNPAMGWMLYIEAFWGGFYNASWYWDTLAARGGHPDAWARASILYIRAPWSLFEPEEGVYCWDNDPNYQALVQGGLDRGLKLAFRVFVDSKDCVINATPQFVKDAGAETYAPTPYSSSEPYNYTNLETNTWTPYPWDPIFRAKFEAFLDAFTARYDNATIVDFIDGNGLGWWGETHHVRYRSDAERSEIYDWITTAYASRFKHVLLGDQHDHGYDGPEVAPGIHEGGFARADQDAVFAKKGYMIRRDSLGNPYYWNSVEKRGILEHWPAVPVFGELAIQSYRSWPEIWSPHYSSIREMCRAVIDDAYEVHSNTLDLRHPEDALEWTENHLDLVDEFAIKCGYRFVPLKFWLPGELAGGREVSLGYRFRNDGVGRLPNDVPNWGRKYRPAFQLVDASSDEVLLTAIDMNADSSTWIAGYTFTGTHTHVLKVMIPENVQGTGSHYWRFAIVNTAEGNQPQIRLPFAGGPDAEGWYPLV